MFVNRLSTQCNEAQSGCHQETITKNGIAWDLSTKQHHQVIQNTFPALLRERQLGMNAFKELLIPKTMQHTFLLKRAHAAPTLKSVKKSI